MLKPKLPQQEQGFTLVEVLVSILIATVFVATAMQAMVVATLFKAKARQYAEATTWIQEDLENIKHKASLGPLPNQLPLPSTTLTAAANSGATVLNVASVDGFGVGDTLKVGSNTSTYTIATSGINTTTKTITLTSGLETAQLSGASVLARCNSSPLTATLTTGFGDYLNDNLPSVSGGNTKTILGRTFTLTRTSSIRDVAPFEVLELKYEVKEGTQPAIATMYTEVIPDAAFQCP